MSRETYNTKQKKLIYALLTEENQKPLSCEEIVEILKSQGTPVGKTTVYRFLEALYEMGEVRKYSDAENKTITFQLIDKQMNCYEHMHLKCVVCGKLIHLSCEFMAEVGLHIFEHHNFVIDNSRTVILGHCSCCKE